MTTLTSPDQTRLAAEAIVSPKTVQRVYAGAGSEYSRLRVREAAVRLGLPPPPEPKPRAA